MIWVLFALFCMMGCGRCRVRRRRRPSDMAILVLVFVILSRFGGHGPWIPIMACIAIGYFLRKIEEARGEDCCSDISDEEMEEGLKDD